MASAGERRPGAVQAAVVREAAEREGEARAVVRRPRGVARAPARAEERVPPEAAVVRASEEGAVVARVSEAAVEAEAEGAVTVAR